MSYTDALHDISRTAERSVTQQIIDVISAGDETKGMADLVEQDLEAAGARRQVEDVAAGIVEPHVARLRRGAGVVGVPAR